MRIFTESYELDWPQNPLFKVGDRVVFLNEYDGPDVKIESDGKRRRRPRIDADTALRAEIVGYLEDDFIYLVRYRDASLTVEWRYASVFEDEIAVEYPDLEDAYPHVLPEIGDIGVDKPFAYMEERISSGLYRAALTNSRREDMHPDWRSKHPDIIKALTDASRAESAGLLASFERDVLRAYGLMDDLGPYGMRLLRHVFGRESGKAQLEVYSASDDSIDFTALLRKFDALVSLTRDYKMLYEPANESTSASFNDWRDSYRKQLEQLPEPYRSQLLYGTFYIPDDSPARRDIFLG